MQLGIRQINIRPFPPLSAAGRMTILNLVNSARYAVQIIDIGRSVLYYTPGAVGARANRLPAGYGKKQRFQHNGRKKDMNRTLLRAVSCFLVSAIPVPGCATMKNPAAIGALTGAVIGAGAGAAIDHDKRGRGALIGAATGAAVGGGIGYLIQRQRNELEQIPGTEVEVQEQGGQEQLLVTMESALLFETDSFALKSGQETLDQIAATLNKYPESKVVVKGYTDSRGSEEHNLQLSERRAESVRNYLVAEQVDPARITSVGFGESLPVASNDTEDGRQQNRRVEIEIIPTESG